MDRRHDDILTTRLEAILNTGITFIAWSEIYRWYDVQKIAAGTWRDIRSRWQEISRGKYGLLKQIDLPNAGGIYLIADKHLKAFYED